MRDTSRIHSKVNPVCLGSQARIDFDKQTAAEKIDPSRALVELEDAKDQIKTLLELVAIRLDYQGGDNPPAITSEFAFGILQMAKAANARLESAYDGVHSLVHSLRN